MFIPAHYKLENQQEALDFMKKYSFATIVSTPADGVPVASHIPLTISQRGESIILNGHFAKANNQLANIDGQKVLVIFNEPHAYISPSSYDKFESVPTWNYFAVHAYGVCQLIHDESKAFELLNEMILNYEPAYKTQWDAINTDYKQKMIKGIVTFKIEVDDIQASKKLSQNKTHEERARIIDKLSASGNGVENELAKYMQQLQ